MSHEVIDKKKEPNTQAPEPRLTSSNHAFYIGKIFSDTVSERIQRAMGWGTPPEHIYSDAYIEAALQYMFSHLEEGEKAYFVVARSMSELFNGKQDVNRAMPLDEEIKQIERIAARKFKKGENHLEVIDIEKQPQHQELFQALRASVNPVTGELDLEKTFSSTPAGELPSCEPDVPGASSLELAKLLYQAAKENTVLEKIFSKAVPANLKYSDEQPPRAKYYALVETAIRLSEILSGRFIHGGVDRQGIYDDVICKIIKGKKGPYKNIKQLEKLFELVEETRFETVHVDTRNNPYHLARRKIRAITRLAVTAALGVATITGAYEAGKFQERKEKARIEEMVNGKLADQLNDITFYFESKFALDKKYNVEAFHHIVKGMRKQFALRYQLPEDVLDELKPFIEEYLLQHKGSLNGIHNEVHLLITAVDEFVFERTLYFESKGIKIDRPYAHMMPYIGIIQEALKFDEKLTVNEEDVKESAYILPHDPKMTAKTPMVSPTLKKLGPFILSDAYGHEFDFAIYMDENAKEHFVARPSYGPKNIYTSQNGHEAADSFIKAMRKYDTIPLHEHLKSLYSVKDKDYIYYSGGRDYVVAPDQVLFQQVISYKDFLGEFEYEVTFYNDYNPETHVSTINLVARVPGEESYSTTRAIEVAKRYFEAERSHWPADRRND